MKNDNFLDSLLSIPMIYDVEISKDKTKIAFSMKNVHPNMDVFYINLNKKSEVIALTETPEMTRLLDFFPKSNAILVMEDKNRNEREQIFRVNIDEPKKMIPLTEENPSYFLRWGDIHQNEKWLFYGINYDQENQKEIEPTWIYRHDLKLNEKIILAKPTKPSWPLPRLNNKGNLLLYHRKELHPKGVQVWVVDVEGKEDREVLNFGDQARVSALWLPDREKIAFLTDFKNNKKQNYYSLGFYNTLTEEIEWIIDDPMRNIEEISIPHIGNHLVIKEYHKAQINASIIDLEKRTEKKLPIIKGNLYPLFPLSNNKWIGSYYSSIQPLDLVKFDLNNFNINNFEYLIDIWKRINLSKSDFTLAADFEWKSDDGLQIHGWLYHPKNPNGKTIVQVHGGPTSHSEDEITAQIQYYTHRGFLVLDPNYRGSTGYNFKFEEAIYKNGWGSDEQNDILSGVKELIKRKFATEGKIGITGTSFGGYSSWFAITKMGKQYFAAAAPICGMTDLVVDYESTRPDLRQYSELMLGGSPSEVPQKYYESSPINFVQNIQGSLLIVQGAVDPNVTIKNVEEVKVQLEKYAKRYEVLIFDDEGHGIWKAKNQKVLYKKIADFFEKNLK